MAEEGQEAVFVFMTGQQMAVGDWLDRVGSIPAGFCGLSDG
jgi:hypothetical protein